MMSYDPDFEFDQKTGLYYHKGREVYNVSEDGKVYYTDELDLIPEMPPDEIFDGTFDEWVLEHGYYDGWEQWAYGLAYNQD